MKKKNIIQGITFILLFFIPIPNYIELNNLILIKSIDITCNNNDYLIKMKEVIPQKEDNGITYKYKEYEEEGNNIKLIKERIESQSNHKFYYQKAKIKIHNCTNKNIIIKHFQIKESSD